MSKPPTRNERRRLIAYLMRGGLIRRDETGGLAYWTRADRGGWPWSATAGDRLRDNGCVFEGEALELIVLNGDVWGLRGVANDNDDEGRAVA